MRHPGKAHLYPELYSILGGALGAFCCSVLLKDLTLGTDCSEADALA